MTHPDGVFTVVRALGGGGEMGMLGAITAGWISAIWGGTEKEIGIGEGTVGTMNEQRIATISRMSKVANAFRRQSGC